MIAEHPQCDLVLRGLVGRSPVRFRSPSGRWVNNVEVTQALSPHALVRFALHQQADGELVLRVDARQPLDTLGPLLAADLGDRFGEPLPLRIEPLVVDDKLRQYTSDLIGHAPR